jgi:IS30 family transposase
LGKLHRDDGLAATVIARLRQAWSPEQIAERMRLEDDGTGTVSHETSQAPWQKGAVENTNCRLQRFLPLDTDLAATTPDEPTALAHRVNATPRKYLQFKTPAKVLQAFVTASATPTIVEGTASRFG